ncbi:MAG: GNAT family N-acetyltransferase [Acidimicrobiales bacterium]
MRPYLAGDAEAWDQLVAVSCNGTFLHTRRFLSHQHDRFDDRSLLIEDQKGKLRGVLPAAVDPADDRRIVSHPGLTYGGLVHEGSIRGENLIAVLTSAADHYRDAGAERLWYKCIPAIHHRVPAQDDLYALFRLQAVRVRCDLSVSIDLQDRPRPRHDRRTRLRRAEERGLVAEWGWSRLDEFWSVLSETLRTRFNVAPTHTLTEMRALAELFPDEREIALVVATLDGDLVAGGILFRSPPVVHLQYSAASDVGREVGGLDFILEVCIARALAEERYHTFDFGTSNEEGGWVLNSSLYDFKVSFGGGGVVYEQYELDLVKPLPSAEH